MKNKNIKDYDFCGYASKYGIKCSDGRTIQSDSFKHHDGAKVPLVWQHLVNKPTNVIGHGILEHRDEGPFVYGFFNNTPSGLHSKEMLKHGDIESLSIRADRLQQSGMNVTHGRIVEVSLVLTGANPGAKIENVSFQHTDGGVYPDDEEAIITSGDSLVHKEDNSEEIPELDPEAIYNSMTPEQRKLVDALLPDEDDEEEPEGEDAENNTTDDIEHGGSDKMKKNIFEGGDASSKDQVLIHTGTLMDIEEILIHARDNGVDSLKKELEDYFDSNEELQHAGYGIENIESLFPQAKEVNTPPEFIKRETGWVSKVLGEVKRRPFSKIKTTFADITEDEARAKGYIKGNLKKEEFFKLKRRETHPTTIYKKQKLDRDDIIDITSFDVVRWIKGEMKLMLGEEIARAILLGDGRDATDEDRIDPDKIRPIIFEHKLFATRTQLSHTATIVEIMESIVRARKNYKGSGNPALFTTTDLVTDMQLLKDADGRYVYRTIDEIKRFLRVSDIVEVEPMEGMTYNEANFIVGGDEGKKFAPIGVIVNISDYNTGADKGGQIGVFDDFDIDYNQYKYLMETRMSGCLVKPKSALIIEQELA